MKMSCNCDAGRDDATAERRPRTPSRHHGGQNQGCLIPGGNPQGQLSSHRLSFAGWLLRRRLRLSSSRIHQLAIPRAAIPRAAIFVVTPPFNAAAIAGVIKCTAPVRPPARQKVPPTPLQQRCSAACTPQMHRRRCPDSAALPYLHRRRHRRHPADAPPPTLRTSESIGGRPKAASSFI
jgi:hypothetical protein